MLCCLGLHLLAPVNATYSIVATNGGYIGASGCTCIEQEGISLKDALYRTEPGAGVLITQALLIDEDSPPVVLGKSMLKNGTNPQDILSAMTDASLNPQFFNVGDRGPRLPVENLRQHAVVDTQGRTAGYTGSDLDELYSRFGFAASCQTDQQVVRGNYTISAQGNIVTEPTIPLLIGTFLETPIGDASNESGLCDLAARLFAASNAVNLANEGDIRCSGIPGTLAFLRVDTVAGETVIDIDIGYSARTGSVNPFIELKIAYEAWRNENGCSDDGSTTPSLMPPSPGPTASASAGSSVEVQEAPSPNPTSTSAATCIVVLLRLRLAKILLFCFFLRHAFVP